MTRIRSVAKPVHIGAIVAAIMTAAPAVAQTQDHAPVALDSAREMSQDKPGTESWTYAQPKSVFLKYRTVIVEPTVVYDGPDAQFRGIKAEDRVKFAEIITNALRTEIAKSFPSPESPQANTLLVKVTLLGADQTKVGISTATGLTPIGLGFKAVKSALGKPATATGSVLFAVEVFDGLSKELLIAAVRRRTPDPLDVPATLSTTDTIKAVARDMGDNARKRLIELTQLPSTR